MTASEEIDKKIADHPDWRGKLLAAIRRLVREADPTDLASAIQTYAKDRDFREKMAKKAFWASDNYSASLVAESIQEVYEHVTRVS